MAIVHLADVVSVHIHLELYVGQICSDCKFLELLADFPNFTGRKPLSDSKSSHRLSPFVERSHDVPQGARRSGHTWHTVGQKAKIKK